MINEPQQPKNRPDLSAAAMPDSGRSKKLRIAALAGVAVLALGGAAVASRQADPLAGERPLAAEIAKVPRAQLAYEAFYKKASRAPSPDELTRAVAKDGGPTITVVGPGEKKPYALRLAGTPAAPALELLDETGQVAIYGETPVVIQVRVP